MCGVPPRSQRTDTLFPYTAPCRSEDAVRATLVGDGFDLSVDVADRLLAFSRVRSTGHDDALAKLDALGAGTPLFEEGRGELRELLGRLKAMGVPESRYAINLSIARGQIGRASCRERVWQSW